MQGKSKLGYSCFSVSANVGNRFELAKQILRVKAFKRESPGFISDRKFVEYCLAQRYKAKQI